MKGNDRVDYLYPSEYTTIWPIVHRYKLNEWSCQHPVTNNHARVWQKEGDIYDQNS